MSIILSKIVQFFKLPNESSLIRFVMSKSPSTVSDIEYWQRQYERNTYIWRRGL